MDTKIEASNFIEAEINKDIENNVYANGRVLTRFRRNQMAICILVMLRVSALILALVLNTMAQPISVLMIPIHRRKMWNTSIPYSMM